MFNYDCVSFSSSIVNVPYVIILSVSICISSLLVWISINTFKTFSSFKIFRSVAVCLPSSGGDSPSMHTSSAVAECVPYLIMTVVSTDALMGGDEYGCMTRLVFSNLMPDDSSLSFMFELMMLQLDPESITISIGSPFISKTVVAMFLPTQNPNSFSELGSQSFSWA